MEIVLKKMETDAEIRGKAYVHWKSWQETYPGIVNQDFLDALTLEKCEEIAYKWPDNLIVAKNGDTVIGFAGYGSSEEDDGPCGEIFALYVLAEYHGQGIGYRLMEEAVSKLKEYRRIILWVAKGNEKAIRFYERYGFRFDGTENVVQLGGPLTDLRMVLDREQEG